MYTAVIVAVLFLSCSIVDDHDALVELFTSLVALYSKIEGELRSEIKEITIK